MGTNNKPTDTEVRSVDFEFVQDEFKVVLTKVNGEETVIRVELTDDEFSKLDQVVFRERMNRFVGYPLREEPFSFDRELDREGGEIDHD